MAKNRNTMAKRSRESEKRRKAQEKAERRKERKERPRAPHSVITVSPEDDTTVASLP